ncbi:hypothetical protein HanIR_Chr03g0112201 [Helianthus annuus]|nr:hypothetical protein HanIR_Chr03g0112201 [Helianthus annuus]
MMQVLQDSSKLKADPISFESRSFKIPSQIDDNSDSILDLYSRIVDTCPSLPLLSSFCTIDDIILHEALPITFSMYSTISS